MTKVIMHGCNGKMGQVITGIIAADEEIEIVVYEDETSRDFLDGRFDHSVAVRLVRKQELKDLVVDFAGFGYYQYNHELSGNWIFQTFEDKRIEQLNINQIPLVCIDTHTRSFSGSGGSYMIYGNIRCEGDFINFEVVMAPEPKNEEYINEKELLLVLQECDKFEVNEEFLYLFQNDRLKLSFINPSVSFTVQSYCTAKFGITISNGL